MNSPIQALDVLITEKALARTYIQLRDMEEKVSRGFGNGPTPQLLEEILGTIPPTVKEISEALSGKAKLVSDFRGKLRPPTKSVLDCPPMQMPREVELLVAGNLEAVIQEILKELI